MNKMHGNSEEVLFPEHYFLLACLRLGLSIQDLKILSYTDIIKIFLSIETKEEKTKTRTATQTDIDRLLG